MKITTKEQVILILESLLNEVYLAQTDNFPNLGTWDHYFGQEDLEKVAEEILKLVLNTAYKNYFQSEQNRLDKKRGK